MRVVECVGITLLGEGSVKMRLLHYQDTNDNRRHNSNCTITTNNTTITTTTNNSRSYLFPTREIDAPSCFRAKSRVPRFVVG